MSGQAETRSAESDRYRAAIAMSEFADKAGFAVVNVEEHHDAALGWLSSPLLLAGMIAARTSDIIIRGSAVLGPLYDPIRLAEDLAMLDLVSRGRFLMVLGQGYRPSEYHAMDRDFDTRGADTDFLIETLLKAWKGEAFDYRGRTIHVSPPPYTQPHPPLYYGGMSAAAARRAARWGLPFLPGQPMPEIEAIYVAECERLGVAAQVETFTDMTQIFVDPDPEAAWRELGPFFLREVDQYAEWMKAGVQRVYDAGSGSIEALRAAGTYEILTPAQCLERARSLDRPWRPILHPLAGGIAPERAWRCLQLFRDEVLAKL
nr:LLM class flavin-dependent oxidoreductase [Sphingomonas laterariae]